MKLIEVSVLVIACSGGAASALAHHSFAAEFDRAKPVTLKGVVSKVEWANPHTRLYLNVMESSGTTIDWELELASPNSLMRAGWTRHSVKIGDTITVQGFMAKDGSHLANASNVFAADGRKVLSELSSADAPPPPK
jgi:Family of unknown function (DUF6152)